MPAEYLKTNMIRIKCEDISVLVDSQTDKIYVNGVYLLTTKAKSYERKWLKTENINREKKRILARPGMQKVFVIDIGWDGRLFFLEFYKDEYRKFRGKPCKKYSYWNDRKNHIRKFYEDDLSNPFWSKSYEVKT